ncbi:hypothetical protein ACFO5R_08280 [Halosolutus amylolyticus]|uniref:CARDB domain-containing protein n=1 Tax=Halosolutus amylolyticus TaxID=2932267 RepID=A0ABD5PNB0_9EURY|nr:hypothetical protein [Halosolutus amylolyticus]
MTRSRVVWLVAAIAILGATAAAVPIAPTAGFFSDASTFEDNGIGAAEWGPTAFEVDAPDRVNASENATLEVTLANDGSRPTVTEYEIVVHNEPVEADSVTLDGNQSWNANYGFDTSEADELNWSVTVENETASGTLTIAENDTETEGALNVSETGNETGTTNETTGSDNVSDGTDEEIPDEENATESENETSGN